MRVKICGITSVEDALNAINCGADALGFVFYEKSPRYITPKKAKEISSLIPPFIERVGLFVNHSSSFVNDVISSSKLTLAQIHFEADELFYKDLNCRYIKVIRARSKEDLLNIKDYVLVDAYCDAYGGIGKRVPLEWFENLDQSKIILAGGVSLDNLKDIKKYNFYGVDVSSSVEIKKGKKDPKKVKDFIYLAKLI